MGLDQRRAARHSEFKAVADRGREHLVEADPTSAKSRQEVGTPNIQAKARRPRDGPARRWMDPPVVPSTSPRRGAVRVKSGAAASHHGRS